MNSDIEQIKRDIQEIKLQLKRFESASQIDPLIAKTITQLLSLPSSKPASSENVTVTDTNGVLPPTNYTVMGAPNRFIRIGDNNVPAYD